MPLGFSPLSSRPVSSLPTSTVTDTTVTSISYPIGQFDYSFSLSTSTNVNVSAINYQIGDFSYSLSLFATDTITSANYSIGQFSYSFALDDPEEFSLSYTIGNFNYSLSLAVTDTISTINYPIGNFNYSLDIAHAPATIGALSYQISDFSYAFSLSNAVFVTIGQIGYQINDFGYALSLIAGGAQSGQGGVSAFARRVKYEHARKLKRLEQEKEKNNIQHEVSEFSSIQEIIDDATANSGDIRQARDAVNDAQKELQEAEQRLVMFLEQQELAMKLKRRADIIKIIAEML